ncbi:MAG: Ig-like domain repeat protein, partial [Candidatus Aenigmarchaeota archaeon]|nr:Ig-like domain repeat protein [Candidatus Aenigmarchaeota archaeon]
MQINTLEPSWTNPAINYFDSNTPFNYPPSGILTEEGNHIYTIYARDKYPDGTTIREVNLSGTIIRDVTAPTISDDYLSDGVWVNLDQTVILTPLDALSYIGDVNYCTGSGCTPNVLLNSPYQLNYNSDQDTIVRYQVWDLATNPSIVGEYNIKLDKTNPITTDDALVGWQNSDQTITLSPTDALSGVQDTFYRINLGIWTSYVAPIFITDEGINTLEYYSTDAAGNIETTNSVQVWIDKSLPVSLITSPTASSWHNDDFDVSRTDTDTYSGVASCEIQILDNGAPSLVWVGTACDTDYLIDTTSECTTEGLDLCEVQIRSTDNALPVAWVSNVDTRTFSIDTTAPIVDAGLDILTNSPIIQDATTSDAIAGIATWSWTQIAGPGIITFGTLDAEDTTIQADTDGVYTIRLTVTDNAGNSAFDEITFTWDTAAPVVDAGLDAITNAQITQDATASDLLSGIETYSWTQESGFPGIITFGTPNDEDTTIQADIDGVYTIQLLVTDYAGNSAFDEITFTWDTIAPIVDITAPLSLDEVNGNALIFFTDDELTNAECSIDNLVWVACASGVTTLTDVAGFGALPEGAFTLYLRDTDLAGNVGTDSEAGIIKDTIAPVVDITAPLSLDEVNGNALITFTESEPTTSECSVDNILWTACTSGTTTLGDIPEFVGLVEGAFILYLRGTDLVGNIGTDSEAGIIKDTIVPVVNVNFLLTNDPSPELTGTIDDLTATIQIDVDGTNYPAINNGDGTWTLTNNLISPDLIDGIYEVIVSATDLAGNIGNDATTDELEIDLTSPTLSNILSAPTSSSATITWDTNENANSSVYYGLFSNETT